MTILDLIKKSSINDDAFKYFIGYKEGEIVKRLCIALPQMSRYIKYFENGGKNMSFLIKDGDVLDKYNEIWNKIKKTLNIKFHGVPVYNEKCIKAREFNSVIKANLLGDEIRKENVHYTCIAYITIDSVMKMKKINYSQVYLEECKYKIRKKNKPKFRNTELKSESKSEIELQPDIEVKIKIRI